MLRSCVRIASILLLATATLAVPIADVVLDWDFEEGIPGAPARITIDRSGQGNHGVIRIGNPVYVDTPLDADPGRIGIAVQGSGTFGSTLRAAESQSLNLALHQSFTLEAVFRPVGDNGRANRTLVQRSDPNTMVWSYGLYYDGDLGQANFGVTGQTGASALIYAAIPNDGKFHRVAGVFDRGNLALYVDGVLRTNLGTTIVPDTRPKLGVSVGAIYNGGYYFNGEIARVRLASRALAPDEFLAAGEPSFEGVPISWWKRWFGDNWMSDARAHADEDPDSDGSSNATEHRNGSNPMDPDSGFAKTLSMVPRVEWRSVPGAVYRIDRRESPISTDVRTVLPEFIATSTSSVFIDPEGSLPHAFYEIQRIR